jgi:GNAT superfamily N-acetyltransferase
MAYPRSTRARRGSYPTDRTKAQPPLLLGPVPPERAPATAPMIRPSRIAPLPDFPADVEILRAEAAEEGYRFVDRLIAEWRSGANRFVQPGEVFLGGFERGDLIAVGGLNRDAHANQLGIGRLRDLYVKKSARRCGVGSALVRHLLGRAECVFHSVRLRTETQETANF